MIVWVLTDDRVGSNNQSIAVAEALSKNFVVKKIFYNFWIRLPNFLRGSSLIGIDKNRSDDIFESLPDIVISASRRLASVALNIKKRSGGRTFVVNILNPDINFRDFDLLLVPKHDNLSQSHKKYGNVVETNGSINRINLKKIAEEAEVWKDYFSTYNRPFVSLIIGGDTRKYKFNPKKFGKTVGVISNIVKSMSGTLLVSTSRRTSDDCIDELKNNLSCNYYLYDWKKENGEKNPYFALLGLAYFIITTADSMSMVSEACSTGKPVYVYIPRDSLSKKHIGFNEKMLRDKYIKEIDCETKNLEYYSYEPLDEVNRVASIIKQRIKEKK